MRRAAENTQLYQVINVDSSAHFAMKPRSDRLELYDAFELKRQEQAKNRLNERAPRTTSVERQQERSPRRDDNRFKPRRYK